MTAVLGLLEALEAAILESPKVPFTDKTIIEENKILEIIDKIRLALQGGSEMVQDSIRAKETHLKPAAAGPLGEAPVFKPETPEDIKQKSDQLLKKAQEAASEIRFAADKYADEVLANLAATATRIIRSIENGRQRLGQLNDRTVGDSEKESHD